MFEGLAAAGAQIVVNDVSRSTGTGCIRTGGASTGGRTRSAAPTTASSVSSTAGSRGLAARVHELLKTWRYGLQQSLADA
jgi:hypothetical protein